MSLNLVNKTTGDLEKVAGNATDKVGNLSSLTTTDKSSCVAAISEVDGDLTRMISKLMFGGYSTYYRTTQTSIDGIVDNVVIAPQTDDTGYFSAENKASIVDFGNRQFVFGWVNTSKKYAWIIVCSFRCISVGTRENASAFTFKSLTS